MLAMLAALQRALLGGGDEVAVLHRLADLAAELPAATDPAAGGDGLGDRPCGPGWSWPAGTSDRQQNYHVQLVDSR